MLRGGEVVIRDFGDTLQLDDGAKGYANTVMFTWAPNKKDLCLQVGNKAVVLDENELAAVKKFLERGP